MNTTEIRQINGQVEQEALFLQDLLAEINQVMVGQEKLVERVLIALLADGHILLEGVPGLAKTLLVKTVAQAIQADFSRLQFTPDLLPADLVALAGEWHGLGSGRGRLVVATAAAGWFDD